MVYLIFGMFFFDVLVYVFIIVLIGGFLNYDVFFGIFSGLMEYVVVVFMFFVVLFFVCYV